MYFVRGRAISGFFGFFGIFCYFFAGGEDSPSSIFWNRRRNQQGVRSGLRQNFANCAKFAIKKKLIKFVKHQIFFNNNFFKNKIFKSYVYFWGYFSFPKEAQGVRMWCIQLRAFLVPPPILGSSSAGVSFFSCIDAGNTLLCQSASQAATFRRCTASALRHRLRYVHRIGSLACFCTSGRGNRNPKTALFYALDLKNFSACKMFENFIQI